MVSLTIDTTRHAASTAAGALIAVEGSSGTGKTTLAAELESALVSRGAPCCVKLPSTGPLGQMSRELLERDAGDAVALAAAADRALVVDDVILPAIRSGRTAIVDRYVLSALALNALSGLPHDFSYALCSRLPRPDLSILLLAHPGVTHARLRAREQLDRYERAELVAGSSEPEAFTRAASFLRQRGWDIATLDVTAMTAAQAAARVCGLLADLHRVDLR